MKLKSIRIHGFKSFAEKTELEFKSNITAIVGPNGSGKSNIVDAIRWVLGEQSLKSLRGTREMSDIIFNGSETRNPLKRAEVALTFDNENHFLNTPLIDVEVKRIVYHTGENEYYINNNKVRLKDINDLFIDSGISSDSLNIISQGSIEDIVNSKPIDRKIILERASRVLKYKTRKIESIKKLEKTNDNLEKIDLIINELETNLEPLKKQSIEAKKYLEIEEELKNLEISLATSDLTKYHEEQEKLQQRQKKLEEEQNDLITTKNKNENLLEKYHLELLQKEEEIEKLNEEYNELTTLHAKLESDKTILLERQKYTINKDTIDEEYLKNKEEQLQLTKEIELKQYNIEQLEKKLASENNKLNNKENEIKQNMMNSLILEKSINNKVKEIFALENQNQILKNNIEQDNYLPLSVKNVLYHPNLKGIHSTIGKLIDMKEEYLTAINVALGSSTNFIVTDDLPSARRAIEYLKEQKLGRATFFPMSVIKSRVINETTLKEARKIDGFIDLASNLVLYKPIYKNIIENQLGNILIVKDMSSMNQIAKLFEYKYRVVTLDGEIVHTGGSLTGGNLKKEKNSFNDKQLLEKNIKILEQLKLEKENEEEKRKIIENNKEILNKEKIEIIDNIYINKKEVDNLQILLKNIKEKLDNLNRELNRNNLYQKKDLENLLDQIKEIGTKEELTKEQISQLRKEKSEVSSLIEEEEHKGKEKNSLLKTIENEIHQNEITINKMDIQMDYLLTKLSETYHLTYEKARADYPLNLEINYAKERLKNLKKEIGSFKMVNLGSIEEYERIKNRYEFLTDQKDDLTKSILDLQNIIEQMDQKMIEKLTLTFNKIEKEFELVFKQLFKGGKGILKLTDPENILESGIEIIAEPPGKKLNNLALLSGGEKTLTAISLLFAILNVFPVPFCVLDEVEAALDEANVDTFGEYLKEQKDKSEYILITHKKRTMEYAETLYGITMQEQGVSKIVSVKLQK